MIRVMKEGEAAWHKNWFSGACLSGPRIPCRSSSKKAQYQRSEPGEDYSFKGQLRFIELTEEEEIMSHLFEAETENPMVEPRRPVDVEAATDDVGGT